MLLAAFITVIHSFRLDARLVVPRQRLPLACDVRASADDDSSAIGNDGSGGMLPPSEMERLQARIAKIQESGMASPSEKLFELATRETPSSLMRSFFATTSPEISQAMQDAITSLLGTLPPLEFDARLTTSGDKLAALMLQLQMTGYMLRNAEYVMTLRRLLQLKTRSMAEYRAAFDKLDLDSSGFIEVAEVEELLQSVYAGDEVPSYEVSSLITLFDVDGDGRISWEEFASALGADEAAEPPSTLLSLPEAEAAASSMAQPKLTGTIKVILDDNSEVEMDANEYMEQLKAEAQLLRQEIQGVIDGKDASPLSTSISAYVSSLPEPQLKLLTSGISEDVVGAMRLLVQYILREPGGSDAELAKDQEVTMEQAKLQTLCLYQLVLGYKLREAEATGEANDAIGA